MFHALATLIREFSLVEVPEAYRKRLQTEPVQAVYASPVYPKVRLVDKASGGKADGLNAGINCARYPLFCVVDADSILQQDSLTRVVQPFLEDASTVASGGVIRLANGCVVKDGLVTEVHLPKGFLLLFQLVEYLRAFLFGRLGWSQFNAVLIISGAFSMFHKERAMAAGGYRADTVGEDMDLVVRLHRTLRQDKRGYRIAFVPDPICWTEAPETLGALKRQRMRWQQGLAESVAPNFGLMFNRHGGVLGWLAFPLTLLFEFFGPFIEILGYLCMIVFWFLGLLTWPVFLVFLFASVGLGVLLSVNALLLEELSFHLYPRPAQQLKLFLVAILENFGYRQLTAVWRCMGLVKWMLAPKEYRHRKDDRRSEDREEEKRRVGEIRRDSSWQDP